MYIPNSITEEDEIDEYIEAHCDDPDVWVDDEDETDKLWNAKLKE
jgi:hypothetical protein